MPQVACDGYIPEFFGELLVQQYGQDIAANILKGLHGKRKVTLRANTLQASREEVASALDEAGIIFSEVPWYGDAFVLEDAREKAIWDLPIYQQGKIYLQSLSSMMPALVMSPASEQDILDMCAAPGGKTCQLAALGGLNCHITACEMNKVRCEKLRFNLKRQGARNVTVLAEDARRLDEFFRFDKILVDAPCSGSGILQADNPKTRERFTQHLIAKCQKSQRALLTKALSLLKPSGTLVYSTCSILSCENEETVTACLKTVHRQGSFAIKPIATAAFKGAPLLPTTLSGAICVAPTELYEGFFLCQIVKHASGD